LIRASTHGTALRNYPHPHNNSRGFLRDDDHFLEAKILLRGALAVISGGNPQLNLYPEF
jgi:hypothetical protein